MTRSEKKFFETSNNNIKLKTTKKGLRPATLKKRLWRRCFPMNFAKFLKILFLQSTSGRLLLNFEAE